MAGDTLAYFDRETGQVVTKPLTWFQRAANAVFGAGEAVAPTLTRQVQASGEEAWKGRAEAMGLALEQADESPILVSLAGGAVGVADKASIAAKRLGSGLGMAGTLALTAVGLYAAWRLLR